MFNLPPALKVEELADCSPASVKSAIDLAVEQSERAMCVDVMTAIDNGQLNEAAITRREYGAVLKTLRRLSAVLDETIKHGGTAQPVSRVTTTDYELPEMPTRLVATAPVNEAPSSHLMQLVAATSPSSNGRGSRRKSS